MEILNGGIIVHSYIEDLVECRTSRKKIRLQI
jgi:hypothetical protein